jgi:hypothetical protein
MATVDECRAALETLAARLGGDGTARARVGFDRSLSCHVTDLATVFRGQLRGGQLQDITTGAPDGQRAQIRLTTGSDDLIDLVEGRLSFTSAWAKGRIRVEAGVGDLLKLRSLL